MDEGSDEGTVLDTFRSFCASKLDLDNKSFVKLFKDAGLVDSVFTETRLDIIFQQVRPKESRNLNFQRFEVGLQSVAKEKGMDHQSLCDVVRRLSGPSYNATKAQPVRFHDDRSTYTGTHIWGGPETGIKGRGNVPLFIRGMEDDAPRTSHHDLEARTPLRCGTPNCPDEEYRLSDLPVANPKSPHGSLWNLRRQSPKHSYTPPALAKEGSTVRDTFKAFCGKMNDMDCASFKKLCTDCMFIDSNVTVNDVDLIFKSVVAKGMRRISMNEFDQALRLMALRKKMAEDEVRLVVALSNGPVHHCTKAEPVRFHDDMSTYTGIHKLPKAKSAEGVSNPKGLAPGVVRMQSGHDTKSHTQRLSGSNVQAGVSRLLRSGRRLHSAGSRSPERHSEERPSQNPESKFSSCSDRRFSGTQSLEVPAGHRRDASPQTMRITTRSLDSPGRGMRGLDLSSDRRPPSPCCDGLHITLDGCDVTREAACSSRMRHTDLDASTERSPAPSPNPLDSPCVRARGSSKTDGPSTGVLHSPRLESTSREPHTSVRPPLAPKSLAGRETSKTDTTTEFFDDLPALITDVHMPTAKGVGDRKGDRYPCQSPCEGEVPASMLVAHTQGRSTPQRPLDEVGDVQSPAAPGDAAGFRLSMDEDTGPDTPTFGMLSPIHGDEFGGSFAECC